MKVLTILAVLVAMTGCKSKPTPHVPSERTESESSAKPTAASPLLDGSAPYKTTVKVGEPLVITGRATGEKGLISLAVTAIEEKPAKLIALFDKSEGKRPYFVRLTVTSAADRDMSDFEPKDFRFVLSDDSKILRTSYTPALPGCEANSAPAKALPAKGASYELCYTVAVPTAQTIKTVVWDGPMYGPVDWVAWSA